MGTLEASDPQFEQYLSGLETTIGGEEGPLIKRHEGLRADLINGFDSTSEQTSSITGGNSEQFTDRNLLAPDDSPMRNQLMDQFSGDAATRPLTLTLKKIDALVLH